MFIDTSQFETGLHFISPIIQDYFENGRVAQRMGNRSDTAAPHAAFRCKDEERYCFIDITNNEEWEKFCGVLENPEWAKDRKFSTQELRETNREELKKMVEQWSMPFSVEEVAMKMRPTEIVAERLLDFDDRHKVNNSYRCKDEDRWCAVAVTTDEEWDNFCRVIGNPDWTKNPKFATLSGRKENEDELERLVEEWTTQRLAWDVMTIMQEGGVPAGVVETGEDQLEHDLQTRHRNFFQEVDHPRLGTHHPAASPFHLSKAPCQIERAPLLGEHNEYVLKEILGLNDEEVVDLVINGVLE
jgi:crotonobetainyl-CoA:carnitine CoA-transferase CaiB-like acyl-CoA transferase